MYWTQNGHGCSKVFMPGLNLKAKKQKCVKGVEGSRVVTKLEQVQKGSKQSSFIVRGNKRYKSIKLHIFTAQHVTNLSLTYLFVDCFLHNLGEQSEEDSNVPC